MVANYRNSVLFVYSSLPAGQTRSGGAIYDRRLIDALRSQGVLVEEFPVERKKVLRPPFWRTRVDGELKRVVAERAKGRMVVISHEALFETGELIDNHETPTVLIVHNYMPRFFFPGQALVSRAYTFGSRRFFERALDGAGSILFLSASDMSAAMRNHGDYIGKKSSVLAPPPWPVEVGKRSQNIIHLDGSADWLPKAMCQLKPEQIQVLRQRGYEPVNFDERPQSGNGLITDRFAIGYKLKLMQMIYVGDVIASFVDLTKDIEQVAPGFPCYKTVGSVDEALDYFDLARKQIPEEAIARAIRGVRKYAWKDVANHIIGELQQQGAG